MAAPSTTIWDLEPHTRAKHEILRRYLQAWVPILGLGGFPEFIYIDGFAGPGRYSKGEDGSPVIALKAALDYQERVNSKITFLFVEDRQDRHQVLYEVINEIQRPSRFAVEAPRNANFEQTVGNFLDKYSANGQRTPPIFALVDPFGWKGVPFETVRRILSFPNCEVLVTFMYEEINRFIGLPQQEKNFDLFFGTDAWRDGIGLADPAQRNRFFHDLYMNQLREPGMSKYVRSFEMRNDRDVTDYFLFYATNSYLGVKKMKESMWKADPSGEFSFSDATDPRQFVLFSKEPEYDILRGQIIQRFSGQITTVLEVEQFVVTETSFRETHYKRQVLRQLEIADKPGLVAIDPPANRKPGTYPDPSQRVRFA